MVGTAITLSAPDCRASTCGECTSIVAASDGKPLCGWCEHAVVVQSAGGSETEYSVGHASATARGDTSSRPFDHGNPFLTGTNLVAWPPTRAPTHTSTRPAHPHTRLPAQYLHRSPIRDVRAWHGCWRAGSKLRCPMQGSYRCGRGWVLILILVVVVFVVVFVFVLGSGRDGSVILHILAPC